MAQEESYKDLCPQTELKIVAISSLFIHKFRASAHRITTHQRLLRFRAPSELYITTNYLQLFKAALKQLMDKNRLLTAFISQRKRKAKFIKDDEFKHHIRPRRTSALLLTRKTLLKTRHKKVSEIISHSTKRWVNTRRRTGIVGTKSMDAPYSNCLMHQKRKGAR